MHTKRTDAHAAYSLYVPENYDPHKEWPLIICLHGGYGRGEDYIWAWLRPAKSKGYLLLSPKSVDVTWSVLQPPLDVESVTRMFDEVCASYAVDASRVYLSGLSDGGTFTYMLGLSRPDMFTGIAPIAGDFHAMLDPMLRRKQGQDLPLYIVHGVHDFIFPVPRFGRATSCSATSAITRPTKNCPTGATPIPRASTKSWCCRGLRGWSRGSAES